MAFFTKAEKKAYKAGIKKGSRSTKRNRYRRSRY